MKKIFKRALCTVLALTATAGSVVSLTACETDNPELKMQIEYDGETYTLEYKMYRKIAPGTVNHFIKLVENKYYDGVCVHDYDDNGKLYTGGYTYVAGGENGGLVEKDYFNTVSAYEMDWTVFKDEAKTTPVYTLRGEFSDNSFKVKNGMVQGGFGALTMHYTEKSIKEDEYVVWVERADGNGMDAKDYLYNSATSLFSISLSTASSTSSAYCTFATVKSGSKAALEKLQAAIAEYEGDFVEEYTVEVNGDDPFLSDYQDRETYQVPVSPIVIKSIKVTKY